MKPDRPGRVATLRFENLEPERIARFWPIIVTTIEDLESLVAITEQTGRRLADVLAAKQQVAGDHADVRTWLSRDRRFPNIARPTYLDAALDEAMDVATRLLGFEGFEDEAAA